MSTLADAARSKRQHWAAAGGVHDKIIRTLQLGLPAFVGALIAVLLFAPFSQRGEISFLLAKDEIAVTQQRVRVEQARYSGTDSLGRAFSVSATSAVQRSAADPVVRMQGLEARIAMADGPATLSAQAGRYDPTAESVSVDGPLQFAAADGFRLNTSDVRIDLKSRQISSNRAVAGSLPVGQFSADRISANLETRVVRLDGHARLRINQGLRR
jgi:lipopolysaccharide export system protein LptC